MNKANKIINTTIKEELGGLHSAHCILYSVDFNEIEKYQALGEWNKCGEILTEAAINLEKAGASFIVICTNTMHKIVPYMKEYIKIPILHIAEAILEKLHEKKIKKTALLGTKYTMKQDFYKDVIIKGKIDVIIPNEEDIEIINHIIFKELCLGLMKKESKEQFLNIMNKLYEEGAEGVILGCTEIGMLIKQEDTKIPLFDTTYIHARKAALLSLIN